MNNPQTLIAKCRELGVTLAPSPDGKLRVSPPGKLPEDLREQLRQRKAEILTLLTQQPAPPPDYRALYEEMTRQVPENMHVVDAWLVDAHPDVWQRIRTLDDELIRLEHEQALEAVYRTKLNELITVCQEAKSLRAGEWGALLVKSALVGCEVWVLKDKAALVLVKDDARPVFFADEIALLKGKNPEQIADILKAKAVFPGCRVVQ